MENPNTMGTHRSHERVGIRDARLKPQLEVVNHLEGCLHLALRKGRAERRQAAGLQLQNSGLRLRNGHGALLGRETLQHLLAEQVGALRVVKEQLEEVQLDQERPVPRQ